MILEEILEYWITQMYKTPNVGTILPAKENTTVKNPGPVQDPTGAGLNEWLQAQQQDAAWRKNIILLEEWRDRVSDSPEFAKRLGAMASWGVIVLEAEAGGIYFDLQRVGDLVCKLKG